MKLSTRLAGGIGSIFVAALVAWLTVVFQQFPPSSQRVWLAIANVFEASVTSHVICRMFHGSLLVVQRRQGGLRNTV